MNGKYNFCYHVPPALAQCFSNFFSYSWKRENFDSLKKRNFYSLEREILTVWKGKFWQFGKGNFDSLEREILTVWKEKLWQFGKRNFDSLEREILTVWKGKFWQFEKGKFWQFDTQFEDHWFVSLMAIWRKTKIDKKMLNLQLLSGK